jgi:putative spermidine/putrescine transport system substrate-binding protein
MVATKTQHINCAYKWLDWIVSPKVNAEVAEYFGEAPSNNKSCAMTTDPNFCAAYHATDAPYWDKVWYWTTPTAKCLDGRTDVQCVPYDKWSTAWTALRSS